MVSFIGWFPPGKEQHPYLRIDTHENNRVMQRAIQRFGFQYCGEVIVGDGTKRLAYDYFA